TDAALDPEYDIALHSCLQTYFNLLERKLLSSATDGSNKDFELLEAQWGFFQEVVRDIDGGQYEMALRYCQLARMLVRNWMGMLARMLNGPQAYDQMQSRDLGKWLCRTLQIVRPPVLKSQRLLRTIQNAVANSSDYEFDDPFPLLAQLVDTKHVLVYTAGEWESRGVFVIGSQSILQKPHVARRLLTSCIMDETMTTDQYRDCYLLVVRTDADFNWTGTSVAPSEALGFQDLQLNPGQLRLISPGVARLERHRQWLERIGIAAKRAAWDTATAATDEIIDAHKASAEDPEGARPSLTAFDGWLDRINALAGTPASSAPARIRELTRAHSPRIQHEWTMLKYGIVRLLDALTQLPDMLRTLHIDFHERRQAERREPRDEMGALPTCRGAACDLLETVQDAFTFVSNTASRGSRFLDLKAERYLRLALLHMCVGWCGFITEDCVANEKRTFRWAVQALEFTMRMSKHNTVQVLASDDWQLIKANVAGCLTLMISHFDILGARDAETKKNSRQHMKQPGQALDDPAALMSLDGISANLRTQQLQKIRTQHAHAVDLQRDSYLGNEGRIGRVIE
ncbi:Suppressor of Sensor Kinase (SLN1), partial [Linderina pennispora]